LKFFKSKSYPANIEEDFVPGNQQRLKVAMCFGSVDVTKKGKITTKKQHTHLHRYICIYDTYKIMFQIVKLFVGKNMGQGYCLRKTWIQEKHGSKLLIAERSPCSTLTIIITLLATLR
jgi:hypothetical protein